MALTDKAGEVYGRFGSLCTARTLREPHSIRGFSGHSAQSLVASDSGGNTRRRSVQVIGSVVHGHSQRSAGPTVDSSPRLRSWRSLLRGQRGPNLAGLVSAKDRRAPRAALWPRPIKLPSIEMLCYRENRQKNTKPATATRPSKIVTLRPSAFPLIHQPPPSEAAP
jgi:hypothetical protein